MSDNGHVPRINSSLTIDDSELHFEFARSSGPGGQNVNKVETKVRLLFDVGASLSLNDKQKTLVREQLATRISKDGILRVTSQRHRSREANRRATVEKFVKLIAGSLKEKEPRVRTRVPKAQRKKRLESKKQRSRKKALRARPGVDD